MQEITLAEIWPQIKPLIDEGCSLMPVWDKDDGVKRSKAPSMRTWKQLQETRMTEGELFQAMATYNTNAVAVITGEISGRLELIDIDSKYEPGVDALLLKDIKEIYPNLYPLLRIHRTPSGGYHIIYRIDDHEVEGNQKLAGREATDEEKKAQRDRGLKKISNEVNFLETRGEGGYFLYPPSLGYHVVQDVPIPQLTWEERCSLINLCRSYDRLTKIAPTPKPTRKEDDFYTENPFEDFNYNCDPVALLQEFGWSKIRRENNKFIWFTRPGKDSGVSASWNKEKGVFFIFTSSTELNPNRGYNPATILVELRFNGDKKEAFKHLVKSGYGKVKRQAEQAVIKRAALEGRAAVPENFSEEAKKDFQALCEKYQSEHPYGVFWEFNKQGDYVINIENLLSIAVELGFRSYYTGVVQINQKFIEKVNDVYFFDTMKEYIKDEDPKVEIELKNVYEKFLKTYGTFITQKRLQAFDSDDVLIDTNDTCYKFYANCYVEITAENIKIREYNDCNGFVWSDKVLPRDYNVEHKASDLYKTYLINSTSTTGALEANVKNTIGWLCHDYNSPARVYIIVMTETVLDPKEGGGSGKNIFANLLSHVIGMSTASGSMVKWDDKFFAVWSPGDRIYFIPDLPKQVDWAFLKNAIENPLVNKKYDREITVGIDQAPKLLFNTNFSYADTDGGIKRRIRPIEFTPFYTLNGGVDAVHGKLFPSTGGFKGDWTAEDWKGFDDMILHCIQYNLSNNGRLDKVDLSETGWIKKFIGMYGEDNYDFIRDRIVDWTLSEYVKVNDFQLEYDNYITALKERYKLGKKKLMSAVRDFCEYHNIVFEQGVQKRMAHENFRAHTFVGDAKQFMQPDDDDDGVPF